MYFNFKCAKVSAVEEEVMRSSGFVGRKIYGITIRYLAPVLLVVILVSSVLNAIGIISM